MHKFEANMWRVPTVRLFLAKKSSYGTELLIYVQHLAGWHPQLVLL